MKNLLLSLTTAALVACGGSQNKTEEEAPTPEPVVEINYMETCFVLNFKRLSLHSSPSWIEQYYGGIELRFYADDIVQSEYEIDYTHRKAAYKLKYREGAKVYADFYVNGYYKLNYTRINLYKSSKIIYNLVDKAASGVSHDYIGSETIRDFESECVSTEPFEGVN